MNTIRNQIGGSFRLVGLNENGFRIGEDHPQSKLTNQQVDVIRELHDSGTMGYLRIARIFSVSKNAVKKIVTCESRWQVATKFKRIT